MKRLLVIFCLLPALPVLAQQLPPGSASVRVTGSSLGRIRLGAADSKIWFGWKVGIPTKAFSQLTFLEAAAKADALGLGSVEGSSTQIVCPEIPKKLTENLAPGERTAIVNRLRELNVGLAAYRVDAIPEGAEARRKLFEFAKALNIETVITGAEPSSLPALELLASEFNVNVAIASSKDATALLRTLDGRGKRLGIAAELNPWLRANLATVKDRLLSLHVRDKAGAPDFLLQAFRLELKPLLISLDTAGTADTFAGLLRSVDDFEKAMRPAMQARVVQVADSPMGAIRSPDRLPLAVRQKIEAAIPRQAPAKPKKARKMLVFDLNMYSGHTTIPHGNLMLDLLGKTTGAYEAVFSNDLSNLKYPKIATFDAVFLNNIAGMVFVDPDIQQSLIRYVREGGGLGGLHASSYTSLDWPEFTEMLGAGAGAHHTEKQVLKIDDPESPLTKSFAGKGFEHTDEFYHFPASSPYSRDRLHILLSIDIEKSDMATSGRICASCMRPDHDYGMSWIRSYGKGRVFFTPLGHTEVFFTWAPMVEHVLAGVQYILGDLEADATPSSKLTKRTK